MFQMGDYVVYKREVCKINKIKEKMFRNKDYYILNPIGDTSLTINVPTDNDLIRSVISKDDALSLIEVIPSIEIDFSNDKMIENEYRNLLNSNKLEDTVKVIKMSYLRNENRAKLGKKLSEKDEIYLKKAEDILYNELSISLGMSYEDVKDYIISKASKDGI